MRRTSLLLCTVLASVAGCYESHQRPELEVPGDDAPHELAPPDAIRDPDRIASFDACEAMFEAVTLYDGAVEPSDITWTGAGFLASVNRSAGQPSSVSHVAPDGRVTIPTLDTERLHAGRLFTDPTTGWSGVTQLGGIWILDANGELIGRREFSDVPEWMAGAWSDCAGHDDGVICAVGAYQWSEGAPPGALYQATVSRATGTATIPLTALSGEHVDTQIEIALDAEGELAFVATRGLSLDLAGRPVRVWRAVDGQLREDAQLVWDDQFDTLAGAALAGGRRFVGKATTIDGVALIDVDDGSAYTSSVPTFTSSLHLEELGGQVLVASDAIEAGRLVVAAFDPSSRTMSSPIVLADVGDEATFVRLARTPCGFGAIWAVGGGDDGALRAVRVAGFDCCVDR